VAAAAYLLGAVVDNPVAGVALPSGLIGALTVGAVVVRRLVHSRRTPQPKASSRRPSGGRRGRWRSEDGGVRFGWIVAGCIGLSFLLRAPYLGTPLGVDEGGLAYVAQNWSQHGDFLYGPYWLDRPPLLVLLFRLAAVGGDLGVRLLGALAAGGLVLAVACLTRTLAGERAGRIGALLAAVLTGSVAIYAVYTPAELLAAVPATGSVLCLLCGLRDGDARWLIGAGMLAVGAALVKQSFLDAGVAGAVFLAIAALRRDETGFRLSWPAAYLAGAALPLIGLELWELVADVGDGRVSYALLGFRLDAVRTLAGSDIGLASRFTHLLLPTLGSGLALALVAAAVGVRRLRRQPVVAVTLGAWLASAAAGVLAGGSYWSHYLIQLVPGCSVAAAVLLAQLQPRVRTFALSAAAVSACAVALGGVAYLMQQTPHAHVARAVAGRRQVAARPGWCRRSHPQGALPPCGHRLRAPDLSTHRPRRSARAAAL
jgi:4-amino-4-deoxy-L-arabinose transferase-like glycosyltransferase